MSSRLVIGQVALSSALSAVRLGGSGCASSGVSVIQPPPLLLSRTQRFFFRPASKVVRASSHLGLQVGDEALGVERQLQRLVVVLAVRLEVGRQIVVGIAVAVGADHPDLLAAQALAQGLQHRDLVGDAVDAILAGGVLSPSTASRQRPRTTPSSGTSSSAGKVCTLVVGEALDQVERLHHRSVAVVVGAELQRGQQGRAPCGGNGHGRNCGSPCAA